MSDQQRHICGMVTDVGKHFDIQHWVFHYRVSCVYFYRIKIQIIFNLAIVQNINLVLTI